VGLGFFIQSLQSITLILINMIICMNLFRFVYIENYQRRSGAERYVPLSAGPLGLTTMQI
jgi:hypothetical protein